MKREDVDQKAILKSFGGLGVKRSDSKPTENSKVCIIIMIKCYVRNTSPYVVITISTKASEVLAEEEMQCPSSSLNTNGTARPFVSSMSKVCSIIMFKC